MNLPTNKWQHLYYNYTKKAAKVKNIGQYTLFNWLVHGKFQ